MSQLAQRKQWFERNTQAEQLEADGKPEEALKLYEMNASEGCDVAYTFERMAGLYRGMERYHDEVEALERAVSIEEERGPTAQMIRLKKRLDTARQIAQREGKKVVLEPRETIEGTTRRKAVKKKEKKGCLSVIVLLASTALLGAAFLM